MTSTMTEKETFDMAYDGPLRQAVGEQVLCFIPLFSQDQTRGYDATKRRHNATSITKSVCWQALSCLDEVGNVHWHLLNLSAVELLDLAHHADIVLGDEVDGNTLSSETTTTTNAMDVVLAVGRKIVVDDE